MQKTADEGWASWTVDCRYSAGPLSVTVNASILGADCSRVRTTSSLSDVSRACRSAGARTCWLESCFET